MRSFFDAAPDISKSVPMLIGSVTEEGNRMRSRPSEDEWRVNLAKAYGNEKVSGTPNGSDAVAGQFEIRGDLDLYGRASAPAPDRRRGLCCGS
jgi:hypothetical protein